MEERGEIIVYQQAQMAMLFQTTRNNITLHIGNIFKEKELERLSVCKDSLLTASDSKRYRTILYNLDVIISVGYRVKSIRGTQFRQWANKVLKEYLLKGYSVNQRLTQLEKRVSDTEEKIDFFVRTSLPPVEGIFYDGQIFDAYKFASDLIKSARKSILLIDNYVDESVLLMLGKRAPGVTAEIYTQSISRFSDYRRRGRISHRRLTERPRQENVCLLETCHPCFIHYRVALIIRSN